MVRNVTGGKSQSAMTRLQLWKLEATERLPAENVKDFYASIDCTSLVILARSEREARSIALAESGGQWWLDPDLTTCRPVNSRGNPRVVLANWPTLN
jgi:hypothetical protein